MNVWSAATGQYTACGTKEERRADIHNSTLAFHMSLYLVFARQFPHPVSSLIATTADPTLSPILQERAVTVNRLHMKGVDDPLGDDSPPLLLHPIGIHSCWATANGGSVVLRLWVVKLEEELIVSLCE